MPANPPNDNLTLDTLLRYMTYNPLSGQFIRRPFFDKRGVLDRRFEDRVAGSLNYAGYRIIHIEGVPYRAHRLAWLWVHGRWPTLDLDHINRIKHDNRIGNLREATRAESNWNRSPTKGRTLPMGVREGVAHVDGTRQWVAAIGVANRCVWLGTYSSIQAASRAYQAAAFLLRDPSWHPISEAAAEPATPLPPFALPTQVIYALQHAVLNPRPVRVGRVR